MSKIEAVVVEIEMDTDLIEPVLTPEQEKIEELEAQIAALKFEVEASQEILAYFLRAMFIRFPELEMQYKILHGQATQ